MEDLIIKDEDVRKLLDKVSDITCTDYSEYTLWCLVSALEDMIYELHHVQEEFDDFKQDVEDNYRPISYEEQIGYNPKDFY